MSSTLLTEYRCACGKLLFKGLLCQSLVEVKCRRCGAVSAWGLNESVSYALLESDTEANLIDASGSVAEVLGSNREYLIGQPLFEIFPLLRDMSVNETQGYALKDAVLTLRDGGEQRVSSCIIPKYQNGSFAGYRIFSKKA